MVPGQDDHGSDGQERRVAMALEQVSTATIATILLRQGVRNTLIRGARPLAPGLPRRAGRAFTMRFIAHREDLATPESWASPRSSRAAIEQIAPGCVVVVDALGTTDAGILGDILAARIAARGAVALITDGAVRDAAGVRQALPVWCAGSAAPPSIAGLTFAGWQEPITCGGVAVIPGDHVVADEDGAVVVPAALVGRVLEDGPSQEAFEAWVLSEVQRGAPLTGLYPPDAGTRARYEAIRDGGPEPDGGSR